MISATASQGGPIRFAGVAVGAADLAKAAWTWTRGRFVAGTLNRLADHLGDEERNA